MDDEEIEVKPSIDKIPDEYVTQDCNTKIHVHLFSTTNSDAKNKVNNFKNSLPEDDYIFMEHSLESDNCKDLLNGIVESCENARGLILFFCGKCKDGHLKMSDGVKDQYFILHDIWTKFYAKNCPHLKNKPKIFIFEVTVIQLVESDGARKVPPSYELRYDTPNEADVLILYHRNRDDGDDDYIENFCENIKMYGESEDITSLATCVVRPHHIPMLISTFTKKFYFVHSKYRGHNHYITEKQKSISSEITNVKEIMSKKQPEKNTLRRSFMKIFRTGSNASDKVKGKDQIDRSRTDQDKEKQKEHYESEKKIQISEKVKSKSKKEMDKKNISNLKIKISQSVSNESNIEKSPTSKASSSSLTESKVVKPRTKPENRKERRKSRTVSMASDDSKSGAAIPRWKY